MDPITVRFAVSIIKIDGALEAWERLNEMIPFVNDEMADLYNRIKKTLDEVKFLQDEIKKG